jgi:uncharacterized membrane protein
MRNKLFTIFVFFLLLPISVYAGGVNWEIDEYSTRMDIQKDSSINVTEKIDFNFGDEAGHGIYRKIPYRYSARGGLFTYKYSGFLVTNENGRAYNFTKEDDWTNINIKVGEEEKLITGQHSYFLSYKIRRGINYFEDHDELYWNAVGTEWENPINIAVAEIYYPEPILEEDAKTACYYGQESSQNSCDLFTEPIYSSDKIIGHRFSMDNLYQGEALTITVSMPKGMVYEPTFWENLLEVAKDNWIVLLPFITLLVMLKIWIKYGRDPKGRGVIIAQFDAPDKLSPAEVGTIIDGSASNKDISSEIIQLAIAGYIKIDRIEDKKLLGKKVDYQLDKLKEPDSSLNVFQTKLLKALFTKRTKENLGEAINGLKEMFQKKETFTKKGLIHLAKQGDLIEEDYQGKGSISSVKLLDLKEEFYQDLTSIVSEVYKSVVSKQYFPKNPSNVKALWISFGFVVGMLGFFAGMLGPIWMFSIVISGVIISIFGFIMARVTEKGALAKEHILGLKEYLKVAEEARIKFHNAPEKNPQLFEKLLPYAMVLGVEKEWAKQFENIYNQNPSWYSDSSGATFNAVLFSSSLSSFATTATQTLSSAPGGGSGFGGGAGGGGGGGGGGGW